MLHRRKFLQMGSLGLTTFSFLSFKNSASAIRKPIVISTWDAGINANKGAWAVLRNGGMHWMQWNRA